MNMEIVSTEFAKLVTPIVEPARTVLHSAFHAIVRVTWMLDQYVMRNVKVRDGETTALEPV